MSTVEPNQCCIYNFYNEGASRFGQDSCLKIHADNPEVIKIVKFVVLFFSMLVVNLFGKFYDWSNGTPAEGGVNPARLNGPSPATPASPRRTVENAAPAVNAPVNERVAPETPATPASPRRTVENVAPVVNAPVNEQVAPETPATPASPRRTVENVALVVNAPANEQVAPETPATPASPRRTAENAAPVVNAPANEQVTPETPAAPAPSQGITDEEIAENLFRVFRAHVDLFAWSQQSGNLFGPFFDWNGTPAQTVENTPPVVNVPVNEQVASATIIAPAPSQETIGDLVPLVDAPANEPATTFGPLVNRSGPSRKQIRRLQLEQFDQVPPSLFIRNLAIVFDIFSKRLATATAPAALSPSGLSLTEIRDDGKMVPLEVVATETASAALSPSGLSLTEIRDDGKMVPLEKVETENNVVALAPSTNGSSISSLGEALTGTVKTTLSAGLGVGFGYLGVTGIAAAITAAPLVATTAGAGVLAASTFYGGVQIVLGCKLLNSALGISENVTRLGKKVGLIAEEEERIPEDRRLV